MEYMQDIGGQRTRRPGRSISSISGPNSIDRDLPIETWLKMDD